MAKVNKTAPLVRDESRTICFGTQSGLSPLPLIVGGNIRRLQGMAKMTGNLQSRLIASQKLHPGSLWEPIGLIVAGMVLAMVTASCSRSLPAPADIQDRQVAVVFATSGDAPTEVDLTQEAASDSSLTLLHSAQSAALADGVITLDHGVPRHEAIRVLVEKDGESKETLVIWHAVQPEHAPSWPLSISSKRRYLVDNNDEPVVWTGDSPWGLTVVPGREEVSLYLGDRAEKKVNVALVRLIDHMFTDNNPGWLNAYGHSPFDDSLANDALDFSRPSEAYWRQVDWVVREAYRHGITILGAPAYVGYRLGKQGWADHMLENGTARLRQYGEWIGRRYAHYPNLVWVLGGDWSTQAGDKNVREEVNAVAEGIKSVDATHLMTAHSHRDRSALDDYAQPWLDVNSSYGQSSTVYERVRIDYQRRPVTPTFLIEGHYGNEHGMTARSFRGQMYQAMLGGAFGQLSGNAPQWYFSARVANYAADVEEQNWTENLDNYGASFLPVIAQLNAEFPVVELVPDFHHEVMTAGYGAEDVGHAALRYSSDLAIAYIPEQRPVTIDMSRFESIVHARWRSPVDGTEVAEGSFEASGPVSITPPANGDWILILEAGL